MNKKFFLAALLFSLIFCACDGSGSSSSTGDDCEDENVACEVDNGEGDSDGGED